MSGCCRGLSAKDCAARPNGCFDEPERVFPRAEPKMERQMLPQNNPLAEARPESLAEWMDEDPLELIKSDAKVDAIVADLRKMRENWTIAEKKKPKAQVVSQVSLSDLGLS